MRRFDLTPRQQGLLWAAAGGAALLGVSAWLTRRLAREAEAANPPRGRFVAAGGMRLHYTEHGDPARPPVVLLHGCGAMAREMEISGLVDALAADFRVLVFDRPGYGHSQRPEGHSYTPFAQAEVLVAALRALGVRRPLVLGHSWGAMVAFAMGLQHPDYLRALVLVSGYHTPSLRLDTLMLGAPALPLVGPLLRHTISPLVGRLVWPAMVRRIFAPAPTTQAFQQQYPVWMSLRPGQLKAAAAETAMVPVQAARLQARARELQVPTVIVAGEKDRLVMTFWQSGRLHKRLEDAPLRVVPGAGHMVHHTHTPAVTAAVREALQLSTAQLRHVPVPPRATAPGRDALQAEAAQSTSM